MSALACFPRCPHLANSCNLSACPAAPSLLLPAFLFIFFFIYFYQLEANYFTVLQWVLSYIDMTQPWSYMYFPSRSPLPPPSLPDPSWSLCTFSFCLGFLLIHSFLLAAQPSGGPLCFSSVCSLHSKTSPGPPFSLLSTGSSFF